MRKYINKKLYYCDCQNFGDDLNKVLFEQLFGICFQYCTNPWLANYIGIGSVLGASCTVPVTLREKVEFVYSLLKGASFTKLTILGAGFMAKPSVPIKFVRKMDYKILRGKLTESYLRENGLLKTQVLLGDPGLLSSYLCDGSGTKKYQLGIVPHYLDLNSPVVFEIYKKYSKTSIIINVQDDPKTVISQIASCENIISSSLHGLIVADSLGIPNMWVENRWKYNYKQLDYFKYLDYGHL